MDQLSRDVRPRLFSEAAKRLGYCSPAMARIAFHSAWVTG